MKRLFLFAALLLTLPLSAAAQTPIHTLGKTIIDLINKVAVPFLLAAAFFVFLFNIVRYFIFQSNDPKAHDQAKTTALYGLAAFFIILSIWGLVNLLVNTFRLGNNPQGYAEELMGGTGNDTLETGGAGNDFLENVFPAGE